MILRDKITIKNAITPTDPDRTVAAHVGWDKSEGYLQVSGNDLQGASLAVLTAVILPLEDIDMHVHRVNWRGREYRVNAEPMLHTRNGTPHHMTLVLYRENTA